MCATPDPTETAKSIGAEAYPSPAIEFVTISHQQHIALNSAANYWQTAHRKAVDRFKWRELKASGAKSQAALQAALELAKG